jgi:hypothetical protein
VCSSDLTDLTPSGWGTASDTIYDDGTNRFIVVDPTTGNLFFRLSHP